MRVVRAILFALCLCACLVPTASAHATTLQDTLEVTCEPHKAANGNLDSYAVSTNVEALECDVACRAYMQTTGWQDWVYNGQQAGLPDGGKRLEAVQMSLRGIWAKDYRIWYRVKVRGQGWTGWASDGDGAGTMGMSLPLSDIQVRLQHAWEKAPEGNGKTLIDNTIYAQIGCIRNKRKVVKLGGFKPSKKASKALNAAIKAIREQGYDVGFVMMDLATHQGVAYNCGTVFYAASSIKAPYMAAAIEQHPEALNKFKAQITDTLVYSWDHTYKEVVHAYGEKPLFGWRDELKLDSDFKSFRVDNPWVGYTARDFAKLWVRIYRWAEDSDAGKTFCSWSENPETSTIHYALGDKHRTQSKAGWITTSYPYWNVTDDGGIVYADNGTYVLAILSSVPADFTKLHDLTRAIDAVHDEIRPLE